MPAGTQLAQAQRHQPRLAFGVLQRLVFARLRWRRAPLRARARRRFPEQVQLDARLGAGGAAQAAAPVRRAEAQPGFGVVAHPAHLRLQQRAEHGVDKIQKGFATAEILVQHHGLVGARAPRGGVGAEDARVGAAEAVDALLHVADQEAVGRVGLAAQGGEDQVLGGVDVLVFVHEHEPQSAALLAGHGGGLLALAIPEQPQGVLLQVGKIHLAPLAFGLGEGPAELLGQLQQRAHLPAAPCPVLRQRIVRWRAAPRQRGQEADIGPEALERFAPGDLFARGHVTAQRQQALPGLAGLGAVAVGRQARQPGGAPAGQLVSLAGQPFQGRRPVGLQDAHGLRPPLGPTAGFGGVEQLVLLPKPGGRMGERLGVVVHLQDQAANDRFASAPLRLDQLLQRGGPGPAGGQPLRQHGVQRFLGQQCGFLLGQDGQPGVQLQLVGKLADQPETEAVERADVRGVEQGQLLRPVAGVRLRGRLRLQPRAQAPAHLGGGGLGEGDHEEFVHADGRTLAHQAVQATLHQGERLARARPGDHQHVAPGGDGLLLGGRQRHGAAGCAASSPAGMGRSSR